MCDLQRRREWYLSRFSILGREGGMVFENIEIAEVGELRGAEPLALLPVKLNGSHIPIAPC